MASALTQYSPGTGFTMSTPPNKMQTFQLEKSVTYRLHLLSKISDRVSQTAYVEDAGIPLSEGRCLAAIGNFGRLSINELASRANLNKGQASRAAQSLVDQELVIKSESPTDRRGIFLTLSADGAEMWRKLAVVIERRNAEIVECLSKPEADQLNVLLDRLLAHARESLLKLNRGTTDSSDSTIGVGG